MLYYFFVQKQDLWYTLAAVKMYSGPDDKILKEMYNTTVVCTHLGEASIAIVDAKWITEVVAMIPLPGSNSLQYYLLESASLGGGQNGGSCNDDDEET